MSGFPAPGPWPNIRKDLEKPSRRAVVAAVAYIGADAPSVLPLKRGDILVCDASPLSIKSNMTSADALAKYHRRGVTVFSMPGLHAKVIASSTWAWIGSANASDNSENNLIEASVRVTKDAARRMQKWANSLASEDRELELADIRALQKIPRDKIRSGPRKTTRPHEFPKILPRVVFEETGATLTAAEENAVENDKSKAKAAARASGAQSGLEFIWLEGTRKVREGDWVVDIRNGRVRYPAQVVRIAKRGTANIVWLSQVSTPNRPTISQLRKLVPELEDSFCEQVTTLPATLKKIQSLFS